MTTELRGNYGIDAPSAPVSMALGAVVVIGWGVGALFFAGWFAAIPFLIAAWLLAQVVSYLYTTRKGKFRAWQRILDRLELRGDERILDAGCGRGMVLCAAAERVPRGEVTGVDLWRTSDQSGNDESVTRQNAELEGVVDRIELVTGDLRELPWKKPRFDVVLCAAALHNIKDAEGREAAVGELARVLKPGGKLVIADIRYGKRYAEVLAAAGLRDVRITAGGLGYTYGLVMRTTVVTASSAE